MGGGVETAGLLQQAVQTARHCGHVRMAGGAPGQRKLHACTHAQDPRARTHRK